MCGLINFCGDVLQDSAVAMRALIEYTVRQRIRDVSSLSVTVEATALQGHIRNLYVNEKNLAQLQKIEVLVQNVFGFQHRIFYFLKNRLLLLNV
jgi:hypothetical protein